MKSVMKYFLMLALLFSMPAFIGCTGPNAVDGDEESEDMPSDEEYERMMNESNTPPDDQSGYQ